ncbi:MAG: ATPase [Paenibacillaceae bacterium]|nr:ATPase [Paenibacillaceae bacterium]
MRKLLPIGISDFRKVVEDGYYYVDKSPLIRELLDNGSEAILQPRPRRFGKTLNLSMLRYYFERTEGDARGMFQDLEILKQGEAYTRHQGKYPVIFLTFKDVKCQSWEECVGEIRKVIGEEYRRHYGILSGNHFFADEKGTVRVHNGTDGGSLGLPRKREAAEG